MAVCAQQTMKMPYHIMQTEGTDAVLPQKNHFFETYDWVLLCITDPLYTKNVVTIETEV